MTKCLHIRLYQSLNIHPMILAWKGLMKNLKIPSCLARSSIREPNGRACTSLGQENPGIVPATYVEAR